MNPSLRSVGFLSIFLSVSACLITPDSEDTAAVRKSAYAGEKNGVPYYQIVAEAVSYNESQMENSLNNKKFTLAAACPQGHRIIEQKLGPYYYIQIATQTSRVNDVFISFSCL